MNSLDSATKDALLDALRAAADDADVRCVVITGVGRAFCVGQDLREHADFLANEVARRGLGDGRPALRPDRAHHRDHGQAGDRRGQRRRGRRRHVDRARLRPAARGRAARASTPRSPASRSRATPARPGRSPGSSADPIAMDLLLLPRTVAGRRGARSSAWSRGSSPHDDLATEAAALAAELAAGPDPGLRLGQDSPSRSRPPTRSPSRWFSRAR